MASAGPGEGRKLWEAKVAAYTDVQGVRVGEGLASPRIEMDTFSCINSQFMDDVWWLKSLRPGLQMLL